MTVNFNSALQAYSQATKQMESPGLAARTDSAGDGFAGAMRDAVQGVTGSLKAGEQASIDGVAGNADLTQVITAVSNAEMTLQTVVAVRDRVVQAYQEIIRMPI